MLVEFVLVYFGAILLAAGLTAIIATGVEGVEEEKRKDAYIEFLERSVDLIIEAKDERFNMITARKDEQIATLKNYIDDLDQYIDDGGTQL